MLSMGLSKLIVQHDDDGAVDEDGDGVPDEVAEVGVAVYQNHQLIRLLFWFYASQGNDGGVTDMGYNEWQLFVKSHKLVTSKSKWCGRQSDLDLLFVTVNAKSSKLHKEAASHGVGSVADDAKSLSRLEFTMAIVLYALNRYVLTKEVPDVSDAVQRFLEVDVLSRVGIEIFTEPNFFRRAHAYTPDATIVLVQHETSLRNLFEAMTEIPGSRPKPPLDRQSPRARALKKTSAQATLPGAPSPPSMRPVDNIRSTPIINYDCWRGLIRGLGFIDKDVSEREVGLCFVWSRMFIVDPDTPAGYIRNCAFSFEDFLEALVRLSVLKALPTDDQLAESGAPDAFTFLKELRELDIIAHEEFLKAHSEIQPWGSEPTVQSIGRMVHHLISCMIGQIDHDLGRQHDGTLEKSEAMKWTKRSLEAVGKGGR